MEDELEVEDGEGWVEWLLDDDELEEEELEVELEVEEDEE